MSTPAHTDALDESPVLGPQIPGTSLPIDSQPARAGPSTTAATAASSSSSAFSRDRQSQRWRLNADDGDDDVNEAAIAAAARSSYSAANTTTNGFIGDDNDDVDVYSAGRYPTSSFAAPSALDDSTAAPHNADVDNYSHKAGGAAGAANLNGAAAPTRVSLASRFASAYAATAPIESSGLTPDPSPAPRRTASRANEANSTANASPQASSSLASSSSTTTGAALARAPGGGISGGGRPGPRLARAHSSAGVGSVLSVGPGHALPADTLTLLSGVGFAASDSDSNPHALPADGDAARARALRSLLAMSRLLCCYAVPKRLRTEADAASAAALAAAADSGKDGLGGAGHRDTETGDAGYDDEDGDGPATVAAAQYANNKHANSTKTVTGSLSRAAFGASSPARSNRYHNVAGGFATNDFGNDGGDYDDGDDNGNNDDAEYLNDYDESDDTGYATDITNNKSCCIGTRSPHSHCQNPLVLTAFVLICVIIPFFQALLQHTSLNLVLFSVFFAGCPAIAMLLLWARDPRAAVLTAYPAAILLLFMAGVLPVLFSAQGGLVLLLIALAAAVLLGLYATTQLRHVESTLALVTLATEILRANRVLFFVAPLCTLPLLGMFYLHGDVLFDTRSLAIPVLPLTTLLATYWTAQVSRYVLHSVTAGVVTSWYYTQARRAGAQTGLGVGISALHLTSSHTAPVGAGLFASAAGLGHGDAAGARGGSASGLAGGAYAYDDDLSDGEEFDQQYDGQQQESKQRQRQQRKGMNLGNDDNDDDEVVFSASANAKPNVNANDNSVVSASTPNSRLAAAAKRNAAADPGESLDSIIHYRSSASAAAYALAAPDSHQLQAHRQSQYPPPQQQQQQQEQVVVQASSAAAGMLQSGYWRPQLLAFASRATQSRLPLILLARCVTLSLGPIALGAFFVGPVRWFWLGARRLARTRRFGGSRFARGLLSVCELLQSRFNKYAFRHMIVYGTDFATSSAVTYANFRARGAAAIVEADRVEGFVACASVSAGALTLLLAALPLQWRVVNPALWVFAVASVAASVVMELVEAVCTTLYACFGECPGVLRETHPVVFARLVRIVEFAMMQDMATAGAGGNARSGF